MEWWHRRRGPRAARAQAPCRPALYAGNRVARRRRLAFSDRQVIPRGSPGHPGGDGEDSAGGVRTAGRVFDSSAAGVPAVVASVFAGESGRAGGEGDLQDRGRGEPSGGGGAVRAVAGAVPHICSEGGAGLRFRALPERAARTEATDL